MLWIESAGDIYMNRKNHIHFRKDALLIVRERISPLVFLSPGLYPRYISLIINTLGYEMVQSVPVLRGMRVLSGLPTPRRRLRRRSVVFHEVSRS